MNDKGSTNGMSEKKEPESGVDGLIAAYCAMRDVEAALRQELKEYRKVVKRCECCNKLEYYEFVMSEPEGYYCEKCWDDVKG